MAGTKKNEEAHQTCKHDAIISTHKLMLLTTKHGGQHRSIDIVGKPKLISLSLLL
jgi:hypothetical protein